jgi:2-methylcitrate synthase/citrate synthase II
MPEPQIAKGLAGVYADTSRISKVFEDTNTLTYYGYPVQDLAAQCRFEEVAYLLWHGELPNAVQLKKLEEEERAQRALSPKLISLLRLFRKDAHPMDTLRTAVSFMGAEDPEWADMSRAGDLKKAVRMFAQLPTIVAADHRIRQGLEPVAPHADLNFSENFFYMYFGKAPDARVARCFDASLTFYAEHGFNASTFAAREITSSLSDIYSAVTGAIGSLKGPLHGGANEAVMHMLLEIGDPARTEQWLKATGGQKKKLIMGFGHRVYKQGDSRVPHMKKYFHEIAELLDGRKWEQIEEILEDTMLKEKNIRPNLDFPVGPAYYLMGFEIPDFTPIFVMSRITGWTAHIMEQLEDNKLMRPLSVYTGVGQRALVPIERRK